MGFDATSGEEILQDNPFKLKPKFFWLNGKGRNAAKKWRRSQPFQKLCRSFGVPGL